MKMRWKSIIVTGAVLAFLASDVMAQGWGGGRGRGWDGPGGPGMGFRAQGQRPMGPGGPQGGSGAWCPLGLGPGGSGRLFVRRLNLTDEQMEKIRTIIEKQRSETLASIKEVLTDEQAKQLDQIQERAGQSGRRMMRPGAPNRFDGAMGDRRQRGAGRRGRMRPGQPFPGGPGAGWGPQLQGGPGGPGAPGQPPVGGPPMGAGRGPGRGIPPIEQMFDKADANQDGALTKEEIRAFHEARRGDRPFRQPQ